MALAQFSAMGEPTRWTARIRALPAALLTDHPWSESRSRFTPLFSLILAGTVAGALEGWILGGWILHQEFYQGDAFVWDAIEHFAWIGCAVGLSAGIALSATRNLFMRLTLAVLFGVLAVTTVVFLYSDGKRIYLWGSNAPEAEGTLFSKPEGWGLYLGGVSAIVTAAIGHLVRRCSGKPKLLLLILVCVTLLSFRGQSLFWEEWNQLHYPEWVGCGGGRDDRYAPFWVGALLFALTPFLACLLGDLAERFLHRLRWPKLLHPAFAAATLISLAILVWASETMPFTPPSRPECMVATSDPGQFITAHSGETFRLWRASHGSKNEPPVIQEIRKFRFRHGPIRYFTYALSHAVAAAGSEDGKIRLWAIPSFRPLLEIDTRGKSIGALAISLDGRYLAAGDRTSRLRLWELRLDSFGVPPRAVELPGIQDIFGEPFFCFTFSPDGSKLVARRGTRTVLFYECLSGKTIVNYGGARGDPLELFRFSENGRFLIVHSRRRAVHILDLDHHTTKIFEIASTGGYAIALSPDGRHLALSEAEKIRIMDISTGKSLAVLPSNGWYGLAAYSMDGRFLVTGSEENGLKAWDSPESPKLSEARSATAR
jgi:hypothetical protein